MKHTHCRSAVLLVLGLLITCGVEASAGSRLLLAATAPGPRDPSQLVGGQIEKLQAEIKALQESIKATDRDLKAAAEELDRAKRAKPKPPAPGATQAEKEKYNHQLSAWEDRVNAAQQKVDSLKKELEAKRMELQVKLMQLKKLQDAKSGRRPAA